jgi:hypothetical protein
MLVTLFVPYLPSFVLFVHAEPYLPCIQNLSKETEHKLYDYRVQANREFGTPGSGWLGPQITCVLMLKVIRESVKL